MAVALLSSTSATFTERDVKKGITVQIAMDCPITTMMGAAPAPLASVHEWEVKTYATPVTTTLVEGDKNFTFQNNLGNKYMLGNRFQKLGRPVAVTKEMKLLANQYNRPDPLVDNITDKTTELYVDVEAFHGSDIEAAAPSAGVSGSVARAPARWISNANGRFTDSATTPDAGARTPTSSILVSKTNASDVTETELENLMASVATARKKAGLRFVAPCTMAMRLNIDGFSRVDKTGSTSSSFPVSRFNQDQNGTIEREIKRYNSAAGSVEFLTVFQLDSTIHALILSPDLLKKAYAQGVMVNKLADNGVQDERLIDVLHTVECLNPQAHGKIITGATA
jgi:hypothetical protein